MHLKCINNVNNRFLFFTFKIILKLNSILFFDISMQKETNKQKVYLVCVCVFKYIYI